MRLAPKLLLLAGMALAIFAMTATSACAQLEVFDEHTNDEHCPAVVLVVHDVSGGCHIEFASTVDVPLHASIPQKVTLFNCEWYLEGVIDEAGEGFFTEVHLDPPHAGSVPCTRVACDVVMAPENHPMIPWPFHLREEGVGNEELETELCTRLITSGEDGPRWWCDLHLEVTHTGSHAYELGHLDEVSGGGTTVFCENNPGTGYRGPHEEAPLVTAYEPHFETTGTEEIGIVH